VEKIKQELEAAKKEIAAKDLTIKELRENTTQLTKPNTTQDVSKQITELEAQLSMERRNVERMVSEKSNLESIYPI
jgi:hypothetical protein